MILNVKTRVEIDKIVSRESPFNTYTNKTHSHVNTMLLMIYLPFFSVQLYLTVAKLYLS